MKKLISTILVRGLMVSALTGCTEEDLNTKLNDGTFRAEYRDYDENGWKDYVEVTIKDGELYEVVFDAESEKGDKLKSEDEGYKTDMETIVGTYPAKYSQDLINQFIRSGKVTSVDIVAGATESTGDFKILITAALEDAASGETGTSVVDRQ